MIQQLATNSLIVFLVVSTLLIQVCIANSPDAYSVNMDKDVYTAHSLISHVVERHTVHSAFACYVQCAKQCLCVSFNFCENEKKCELNSRRKKDHPEDFQQNEKCSYYEFNWREVDGTRNTKTCGGCCTTSKPCLNDGICRPVDHIDGQRYQCTCADGYYGIRCENKPRSCADYSQSRDRSNGLREIYTGEDTVLKVFCHFEKSSTMTLAMSYSFENNANIKSYSLQHDHPINQASVNWFLYRLPLAHMQGLHNVSTHWAFTCAYDTRGFSTTDHLLSKTSETDITSFKTGSEANNCRRYEYVNIDNNICENCRIKSYQGNYIFHISNGGLQFISTYCDGLQFSGSYPSCGGGLARFFGHYKCILNMFSCAASPTSTTQLWYITNN